VQSAVIALRPYSAENFSLRWKTERGNVEDIMAFAAPFFAKARKKMTSAVPKDVAERLKVALCAVGESVDARPAVLSPEKWVELWKKMRTN
jgi:16S rRNA A1518/A1519 N6-dimethyltransferase RsmA/KsgA/DIM1 with predicted DNA glycosylase/AP lyase activity